MLIHKQNDSQSSQVSFCFRETEESWALFDDDWWDLEFSPIFSENSGAKYLCYSTVFFSVLPKYNWKINLKKACIYVFFLNDFFS